MSKPDAGASSLSSRAASPMLRLPQPQPLPLPPLSPLRHYATAACHCRWADCRWLQTWLCWRRSSEALAAGRHAMRRQRTLLLPPAVPATATRARGRLALPVAPRCLRCRRLPPRCSHLRFRSSPRAACHAKAVLALHARRRGRRRLRCSSAGVNRISGGSGGGGRIRGDGSCGSAGGRQRRAPGRRRRRQQRVACAWREMAVGKSCICAKKKAPLCPNFHSVA